MSQSKPEEENPAYCAAIFKGLYVEKVEQGIANISSCCINTPHKVDRIDFTNGTVLQQQREDIAAGIKIESCDICWKQEENGVWSNRQSMNRMLYDPRNDPYKVELVTLDYNVDPVCNAKCIMCGSYYSSLWAAEDWEHQRIPPPRPYKSTKKNNMLDTADLSNLRRIYFNGGEPFLTDDHVEVLESIPDLSNTLVAYNTNGSIMPSDRVKSVWSNARNILINVSIDGIESTFEYVRNPLKWSVVSSNVVELISLGYNVNLSYTVGIYNLLDIKSTRDWFKSIGSKGLFNVHLCSGLLEIQNAPKKLKEIFLEYLNDETEYWVDGIRNTLHNSMDIEKSYWMKRLDALDERRGNSWRKELTGLANTYIVNV